MTTTGRDRVWSLALRVAHRRAERGFCREVTPEAVARAAEEAGLEVSTRTVRRVLDAMSDTGVLEDVSDDDSRQYRRTAVGSRTSATDMSSGRRQPTDISVDGSTSALDDAASSAAAENADLVDDEPLIYHLFADTGVESEPLSAYGRVVRVGLDPRETAFSEAVRADATRPPLAPEADLVVVHPDCRPWATATRLTGDPDDYPRQIEDARRVARQLGDHYVLENVPAAPLEDAVELDGRMFGLPVPYRRAFETSFPVETPPLPDVERVRYPEPFATDDGSLGMFRGEKRYWRAIKHVAGDYPARPLKHSGIPAPYIHHLVRWWLYDRDDVDPGGVRDVDGGAPSATDMSETKSSGSSTDTSTASRCSPSADLATFSDGGGSE